MRIRYGHILIAALMGAGGPAGSADGSGLQANDSSWFHDRWQARIELSQGLSGPRHIDPYNLAANTTRSSLRGLAVLRDYYFDGGDPPALPLADSSGLRATGGLVVTQRSVSPSPSSRRAGAYGRSAQGLTGRAIARGWSDPNNDLVPVPYVGLGYIDLPSIGWSFRADFGLMALSPQSAVKFGSALSGAQGIDDLLRDMRLSPLIQIGVSYSF